MTIRAGPGQEILQLQMALSFGFLTTCGNEQESTSFLQIETHNTVIDDPRGKSFSRPKSIDHRLSHQLRKRTWEAHSPIYRNRKNTPSKHACRAKNGDTSGRQHTGTMTTESGSALFAVIPPTWFIKLSLGHQVSDVRAWMGSATNGANYTVSAILRA